jgi:hypothetical protein
MLINARLITYGGLVIASWATAASASSCPESWSKDACQLFSESMEYLDRIYDPVAAYVFHPSAATALRHDIRTSVWYAVGLLARNQNDDVAQAMAIIQNVIEGQFKDPKDQW